jgi:tRNA (guanine37-N1)-methyltransferase
LRRFSQRVRDHFITKEISIGDYVLSGGELGAWFYRTL